MASFEVASPANPEIRQSQTGAYAGLVRADLRRRLPDIGPVVEELADGLEETYRRHLNLGLAPEEAAGRPAP
jgi:hypothetical protein